MSNFITAIYLLINKLQEKRHGIISRTKDKTKHLVKLVPTHMPKPFRKVSKGFVLKGKINHWHMLPSISERVGAFKVRKQRYKESFHYFRDFNKEVY